MADLTGTTPADTYKGLLQVNDYTDGVAGNTGSNALAIQDGAGNATALAVSTDNVGIGTTDPRYGLEVHSSNGSGIGLKGSSDTNDGWRLKPSGNDLQIVQSLITNGEVLTLQDGGNVGIGATSPSAHLDIRSSGKLPLRLYRDTTTTTDDVFQVRTDVGGTSSLKFYVEADGDVINTGDVLPATDNAQDIGSGTKRWDDIYATNGTIDTSDRELKQDIEELSEAETRVAQACKGLLRKYRWKSSVAEKGDDARIHFGIMAQDLEAAFAAEGLDAGRYGMFIKNTWWEADRVIPAVEAVEAVEAVYDEEGKEVSPAVEAVEAQPERTELDIFNNIEDAPEGATEVTQRGVRYAELLAFIIAAI